jgi:hypothetical protein
LTDELKFYLPDLVEEFYSLSSVYESGSMVNSLIQELGDALNSDDDFFVEDESFEHVLELWIQMPETRYVIDTIKIIIEDAKEINFGDKIFSEE